MALRRCFVLAISCLPSTLGKCTDNPPVVLPITDVALSSGNSIRGALMSIGNPPQNLSWIPQMYLNDTWAYNTSSPYCPKDKTKRWCETYRGGLYDPGISSDSQAVPDVYAAGASPSDIDRTEGLHVWENSWTLDNLDVGNITLGRYPIGMPGFDYGTQYHPQGAIGLGPNSTLLSFLKDAGHTSSRSYGYWWGEDGATSNAKLDGSLVLGGYDAAKIQGPNITNNIKTPSLSCMSGMHMTITDIVMRFPNSTRSSIIAPRAPLSACLQIDFPSMLAFPRDPYYDRFEGNTQSWSQTYSMGIEWWNPLYDPSSVYQGSLGVVFDSGLELTIPNELLVVPEKLIDDSGKVQINSTSAEVLIQPTLGANAADTPLIGKQFFSSTYLFVNHDAGTFTIWQANSTTDTRLVSVGSDCEVVKIQETPLVPAPSSSNNPLSGATDRPETAPETENDSPGLSTGLITGIAVGAAGLLAAVAVIIYLCFVRRKKKAPSEKGLLVNPGPSDDHNYNPYTGVESRHELHNVATSELAAASEARELDGVESKHGYEHGYMGYKSRDASHSVYELATRSPR